MSAIMVGCSLVDHVEKLYLGAFPFRLCKTRLLGVETKKHPWEVVVKVLGPEKKLIMIQ